MSGDNPGPQDPSPDRDELERQIEETRAELAGTVEALAHKADVKSRAQEFGSSPEGKRAGAIGLGIVVVAALAWLLARRRK